MILNSQGCLTGCGLHGYSLVSDLLQLVIAVVVFNKNIFFSCFSFVCLFCFLSIIVEQWRNGLHQV